MATITVAPTPQQRKNIALIVGVLRQQMNLPEGDAYSHHTVNRCTVGVAVRSKLFPQFNDNTRITSSGTILTTNDSDFGEVSDVAFAVFGKDYYDSIVYGGESSGLMVYKEDDGKPQISYIIDYIIKRYRISEAAIAKAMESAPTIITKTVEVDTTKAKLTERIAENDEFIRHCNAVLARIHSPEVEKAKNEAYAETRTLQKFL